MCAEVLALIGDVVSLPYGALSLPLDISVLSRAVFVFRFDHFQDVAHPDLDVSVVSKDVSVVLTTFPLFVEPDDDTSYIE